MRKVERVTVDAVLVVLGSPPDIPKVNEKQHFNTYRAPTLRIVDFEVKGWINSPDRTERVCRFLSARLQSLA